MPTSLARSIAQYRLSARHVAIYLCRQIPHSPYNGYREAVQSRPLDKYELRREDREEDQERVESFQKELEIIIKTFRKTSRKLEESGGKIR